MEVLGKLKDIAKAQQEIVVALRRHLHRNPETRWQENNTLDFIVDKARTYIYGKAVDNFLDRSFSLIQREGGVWIDVTIDPKLDRIILRADVDALPVQELNTLDFVSKIPGKMHACGHDCHAAILLGFLKAICENKITLKHNLRLVWQRAEENPGTEPRPESGGKVLVDEGVCKNISQAYALHVWATGEAGVFYSRSGPFLGNSDRLKLIIRCSGGHVAQPHKGTNALRIAQLVMNALESFPSYQLGPMEPCSLEPTILKSGTASNIMPAEAELWYGVRTMLKPADRDLFFDALEDQIETNRGWSFPEASIKIERIYGHPALVNDAIAVSRVKARLQGEGEPYIEHERILGGEDFAYYLQKVPGCAVLLGVNQPGCGDHHSPTFNPDESVFWKGVFFWLMLACN